jgi:hypothetical protein
MGALMKVFAWVGLGCLLAQGVFAERHGGGSGGHAGAVTVGRNAAHAHASVRSFQSGRYGGYGYGGFYGDDYQPSYDSGYYSTAQSSGSGVMMVYPAAPIVPETAHSVIHEYTQQQDYGTVPNDGHPILYLIAFRDTTIRAAMTYWVADGTLHYLDTNHQEQRAPISSVDREMSAQLNRERHVPFSIQ